MRGNALTEIQARKILADLYEIRNGEQLPGSTARTFFTSWASNKVLETADSTGVHYQQVVRSFIESLGKRSEADLSMLTPRDVIRLPRRTREKSKRINCKSGGQNNSNGAERCPGRQTR